MIFDTHCHYNLSPLYENWLNHWQQAQRHGVTQTIIPGTNIETSRRAVEIAHQDKNLFAAVGIHPHEYDQIDPSDIPTLMAQHATVLAMLIKDNYVIGIGETGLDYHRLEDEQKEIAINNQQAAFRMHLALANEFKKVLIVHARDKGGKKDKNNQAYWDILQLIKQDYQYHRPFILHCVSGPPGYLQQALKLGAYIGVGGNVTYPSAKELREIIKLVPKERLLLETDAPYLPPLEFRGQICEPRMIAKTARYLEQKGLNLEQIRQNSLLFRS